MRGAILAWHDENARALPWCGEQDPYRIWVSEIMLQQTRAETVIPYYRAFLEAFADVRTLAEADESAVLKRWEGLGYYSRARNLKKAAQMIEQTLGGRFPTDVAGLRQLPGVGEYTAGAIASMAYGLPEPAIDGNQIRVLTRLFDVHGQVNRADTKKQLREYALALIDRERPGDFNQALMGLGALICTPRNPDCEACPARAHCAARDAGTQKLLPMLPEPVKKRPEQRAVALVFWGERVLVNQRPDRGLLAGLYEFPNFENAHSDKAVREALLEWGIDVRNHQMGPRHVHVFTHLIWHMTGHVYTYAGGELVKGQFVDVDTLGQLPMPTAIKPYTDIARSALEVHI